MAWYLLAVGLMVVSHRLWPVGQWLGFPWRWLGLAPLVGGLLLATVAARRFLATDTPIRPFQQARRLVTEGPYRYSRNPMYLGLVLMLSGLALLLGTVTPLLVVPLFALVLDRTVIVPEEAILRATFGTAFDAYRRRVRRWL